LRKLTILAAAFGLALFIPAKTEADIILTPSTTGVFGDYLGPSNCEPGCIETAFGLAAGSLGDDPGDALYKAKADGTSEEGFAGSYETVFDNDDADATISYVGGPSISCPACYLVIKDGNHDPSYYFYNLGIAQGANGIWDGTEDIVMTGFWPDGGAISHVAIWGAPRGGTDPGTIPEAGSMLLFGSGLAAVAAMRRRRKNA
jgi:hypothetical protein